MTKINTIILSLSLLLPSAFAIACEYPSRPTIPDGGSASKDEMLAAKADVQAFMEGVDNYLQCIEDAEMASVSELDNPSAEVLQRREEMLNKKFDAANDEKALLGEQFNQQIRAYNAKLKESD